jgi:hypothetical protein
MLQNDLPDFSLNEAELLQFFENPLVKDDLVAGVDLQDLKYFISLSYLPDNLVFM